MLKREEKQFAIEDARVRHAALLQMLLFTDTQAMSLLRLYATLGVAAASGATAGFVGSFLTVPDPFAFALFGAAAVFFVGCLFSLWAMRTANVSLPGRGAEFWLWATDPKVTFDHALDSYLKELAGKGDMNLAVNTRAAFHLRSAKRCGAWSPVVAFAFGLGAYLWPACL